jgi:hypothetical protein
MLSDANDQTNTSVRSFNHGGSGGWRRNKDQRSVGARLRNTVTDSAENFHAGDRLARFLGMNSANNFRAVLLHEFRMELALLADTLQNNFSVLINEEKRLVK